MTKKIFRSIVLVAVCALLASLLLIMGCLYDYFTGLQSQALRDELTFAASGVSQSGEGYLDTLSSSQYRLTWIAADGTVLYDTQADAASMENHASREEVQQALATGEGESSRYSQTLLEKTIYYAKKLTDGSILRISISRATAGVLVMGMLVLLMFADIAARFGVMAVNNAVSVVVIKSVVRSVHINSSGKICLHTNTESLKKQAKITNLYLPPSLIL